MCSFKLIICAKKYHKNNPNKYVDDFIREFSSVHDFRKNKKFVNKKIAKIFNIEEDIVTCACYLD